MRVAMMGTPDFALPALKALIASSFEVVAAYCQPPRRAGRGKRELKMPVHRYAQSAGIPVFTPRSFKRNSDAVAQFRALKLDVAVVAAYGLILPQEILDAPRLGCINIHASLLPRWRGAAPIHRAILAGDSQTGISIMQMEAGLDTGPVLMREAVPILDDETTGSLHDRLAALGAELIVPALSMLDRGEVTTTVQPDEGVTYAHKIEKAEAEIIWSCAAVALDRQVRAFAPFPGAFSGLNGERLKILGAEVVHQALPDDVVPGTTLDDKLTVATGEGALRLTKVQRAGKPVMSAADFLRGYPVPKGIKLCL
ncbi:MAG: methionyl-tRNA formyltransferase [Pseudomonadota bacterium]